MDEELQYITNVLQSSLQNAAKKFAAKCEVMPSADPYGAPGVLLFRRSGPLLIACAPWADGTELIRYAVQEPGKWRWEFPAEELPENLPFFGRLPLLYDRIRFGQPAPEQDNRQEAEKLIAQTYALTRLPALKEVLSDLGMETVSSVDEDGIPCLVAVEGDVFIRFSYEDSIPELELTVLRIRADETDLRIPEYGNIREAEDYKQFLEALF